MTLSADNNSKKSKAQWFYLEEYKHCSCTQAERFKKDLLGYCTLHGNDRRHVYRLAWDPSVSFGYVRM